MEPSGRNRWQAVANARSLKRRKHPKTVAGGFATGCLDPKIGKEGVGVRDGLDEELDVAALPIPHLRPDQTTVPDVEHSILGEARAERLDVRQPFGVEAVGEAAVVVVVDVVAEKNRRHVIADDPRAVVRRLAVAAGNDLLPLPLPLPIGGRGRGGRRRRRDRAGMFVLPRMRRAWLPTR